MTGMTPLVRAKVDSIADWLTGSLAHWLAFFPHVWLAGWLAGLQLHSYAAA